MNQELDKLKFSIYFLRCCVGSPAGVQTCLCISAHLVGMPTQVHLQGCRGDFGRASVLGREGMRRWTQGRRRCFEYWVLHVSCICPLSADPLPRGCKWKPDVFTQHYLKAGYRLCCLGTTKGLSMGRGCPSSLPHHCRPLPSMVLSGPLLVSF